VVALSGGAEVLGAAAFAEGAAADLGGRARGPAVGGRLLGKDGSPMGLEGFRTTIESYLVSFFNVMRLAAAIARSEPSSEDGGRGVIINTAGAGDRGE
jgi:hypothetical protein